jgi:hypothetical protein
MSSSSHSLFISGTQVYVILNLKFFYLNFHIFSVMKNLFKVNFHFLMFNYGNFISKHIVYLWNLISGSQFNVFQNLDKEVNYEKL